MTGRGDAAPSDEIPWLACEKDADCTSVELGCYYWQPVNAKYAEDMKKYMSACAKSVEAGPQPSSRCADHLCVDDPYTVKYWKQLDVPLKNGPVDKRILACLDAAKIWVNRIGYDYVTLREPFLQKLDELIAAGTFDANQPLEQVVEFALPCDEVDAKARIAFGKK